MTFGSVMTLTHAGRPLANARSTAGMMSAGSSTSSPYAPNASAARSYRVGPSSVATMPLSPNRTTCSCARRDAVSHVLRPVLKRCLQELKTDLGLEPRQLLHRLAEEGHGLGVAEDDERVDPGRLSGEDALLALVADRRQDGRRFLRRSPRQPAAAIAEAYLGDDALRPRVGAGDL